MKFPLKNWKNNLQKLISRLFDEVHFSPIFFIIRLVFIFQDKIFYCTKKFPKNLNQFWYFRQGGETHFLVLAQTLIYVEPRGHHHVFRFVNIITLNLRILDIFMITPF